jgi:hypothetical protein
MENENQQKGGKISPATSFEFKYWDTLKREKDKMLKGTIFRKITIDEKLKYLAEICKAEINAWEKLKLEFPNIDGYTISIKNFEYCEYKKTNSPERD